MASRQVRNLINNQIDSVVARAETEVRNEAKKKLIELKQKVSSPEEIIKMLETTISEEGCSPKAIEKFYTVHDQIMSKLTNIEGILTVGLDKLTLIEEKINPIINGEGPVSKINGIVEFLQPITNTLKGIIALAPILLAANSGPTSSGAITDQVSTKKNKAESKIKEYAALFMVIPAMILFYQKKARVVSTTLSKGKTEAQKIFDEVVKLQALLGHIVTQFETGCDELLAAGNPSDEFTGTDGIPTTNVNATTSDNYNNTSLENYLAFLQTQYNEMYQQLIASGNEKAVERTFRITGTLEKGAYIKRQVINL